MAHVDYKDMRDYLGVLEENGLLKHITAPVDLDYEIGAQRLPDFRALLSRHRLQPGIFIRREIAGKPAIGAVIDRPALTCRVCSAAQLQRREAACFGIGQSLFGQAAAGAGCSPPEVVACCSAVR